jgi:hypothetical protein
MRPDSMQLFTARGMGWEIVGIREGYDGIMEPELAAAILFAARSNSLTAVKWKWIASTT